MIYVPIRQKMRNGFSKFCF